METKSSPLAVILGMLILVVGVRSLADAALSTPFLVKDILPDIESADPIELTNVNGILFVYGG
jgi:hypothetical protein